ncbi:MAG: hypothetical protein ACOC3G_01680 [Phycisphaeraceae bacterium]
MHPTMKNVWLEIIESIGIAGRARRSRGGLHVGPRLMALACLGVLPSAAAGGAGNADTTEQTQAVSSEREEPIAIDAKPSRVHFHSHIRFTEDGIASHANEAMSIVLMGSAPASFHVIGYEVVEEPIAVTNKGEKLRVVSYSPNVMNTRVQSKPNQQNRFQISINATPPTIATEKLERITARMKLKLGTVADEKREIGPLSELVDKTVDVPGEEDCQIHVSKHGNRYRIKFMGNQWQHAKLVQYRTNDGKSADAPLSNIRRLAQQNHDYTHHTGAIKNMNQGKVVVQFWKKVTTREARLKVADVPIGSL